jgi:hypothetical protein
MQLKLLYGDKIRLNKDRFGTVNKCWVSDHRDSPPVTRRAKSLFAMLINYMCWICKTSKYAQEYDLIHRRRKLRLEENCRDASVPEVTLRSDLFQSTDKGVQAHTGIAIISQGI